MSFLQELKQKKQTLSHTKTSVRSVDGKVYEEDFQDGSRELKNSTYGFIVDTKPDLAVAYVLQGLLMGSQDVALSPSLLEEHNISHVLSLGIRVPIYPSFSYTYIEAFDLPEFDLSAVLSTCFEVINKIRAVGKTVYVHCNAGVSRSATVVIGYLMKECEMDFETAYRFLKNIRPAIKPNEGFRKQLILYERSLKSDK